MNLINQQAIKNNKSASLITDYHAKYFAHDLLRSSTEDGIEKISRSLFDVQGRVDLNPHQIDILWHFHPDCQITILNNIFTVNHTSDSKLSFQFYFLLHR